MQVRLLTAISALPLAMLALSGAALASQSPKPPATQGRKAPAPAAASRASAARFDETVQAAAEARKAEKWEEAIALYAKAVKLKPDFVEGYWYQGTALYTLEKFPECRDAFKRVTRLSPKNGGAFAFLGLCEFGVKDYERALQHLVQSRILGVGDRDLGGVARYHAAVLMTRIEQFEQALETLGEFASDGNDNPRVIEAMGIATLRMAMLPNEVPPDRREMVLMAGRGSFMMATRQTAAAGTAFQAMVERYPETPNVHYAYGVFLLIEQPDKAIEQFKRELTLQPNHSASLMQIAYEYIKEKNAEAALPWAKQAVEVAPSLFASHKALGDALLESGDLEGALRALQTAAKLAPDSPSTHLSLAKVYQRAGRTEDATREREEFARLDRLLRTNRAGAQSVGGIEADQSPKEAPSTPQ
jgi:tetratricopeptide (TPR) repeat protein